MTIHPQGEALRKAVKFISDEKQSAPETRLGALIQKACMKFDLTPKDAEYLAEMYKSKAQSD